VFIIKNFIYTSVGLTIFAITVIVHSSQLTTTHYTIETDKLQNPVRLLLLADLHSKRYGEDQQALLSKIHSLNPDVILMSGDIIDDKFSLFPIDAALGLFDGLADYPVFYVLGNHEIASNNITRIKSVSRQHGVIVLDGQHKTIEVNGQRINIAGTDDPLIGRRHFETQLYSAFDGIDNSLFTIFLNHRPERFSQVSHFEFDLMLAGHAHGGHWRIPFLNRGFVAPGQGILPNYTSGPYEKGAQTLIVSRGLSSASVPIPRLFNPFEVVVIDVVPK